MRRGNPTFTLGGCPAPQPGRTPTRDVEIDGTTIPRGALVLLASANRDEHQYQAPDELRIALATLLPRIANIAPGSDSPIERIESFMLRGPTRLDLRFDPAH